MHNNQATKKLAPNLHELTGEQERLIDQIEQFINQRIDQKQHSIFTIFGDAGTGKSVILSQLFFNIQQAARRDGKLHGTKNYFLVNHPEILKVYKQIAGSENNVLKKNFMRPTSFINQMHKKDEHADVVIVDEAHLLLSSPDHYNNFYQENQLEEIIKSSKVVIAVFDMNQVLRTKCYWDQSRLKKLLAPYYHESYQLTHQFRMTAKPDLVHWMNEFTAGKLLPIPRDADDGYDFRIFDDAEQMRQEIVQKNNKVGLSRIVSTTGYPSTLDGGKHYIRERGGFKMPWDQYNYTSTPWAEIPQTIDEVGSIYTCQGFDLNYVGIILGPPIYLDPNDHQIKVDLSKQTDVESKKHRKDITDPKEFKEVRKQIILNSVNVLMKRGVYGTFIFAHDPELRKVLMKSFQQIKK
ncbi:DUF2075 domain-containing protein [Fructilactobacillus fructivorans]|uniref:Schlafen group 3-like DNA/RNA helicase domain-containing protein n=1 Tax=Fructilactobacillus fructivorans TaxID=1614 RepID=A0A0C1LZE4_9LACO|nr:DUF2075 domain-containing protein [Fructilactobacillus fructivorans]KID42235.1 hypothetical protein LfDm3_0164 [Fructilactobacillus fructivorans]MCT0151139.1 DUF2075 domain-containing protein [Fructilactobacillus fructivorans]MCT2867303.1 DUF2075 domain-containing protein [Fructilactobacillus fructivorans]MCT2869177.1 DUF2075 domain-containing protein [Fructilactobacillus fructivorans]MCT2873102.1 DUF2075 domain-containing protein [Fructilactobacillus fructivorans]